MARPRLAHAKAQPLAKDRTGRHAATPLHAAQASAQHEMAEWMQVIQNGTAACLGSLGVRASAREEEAALPVVREVAGNGACADCGAPAPTWASINLGVTLCLACAGVHRRLGTHLSKVCARSSRTRLAWPCPRGTPLAADTKTHASSSKGALARAGHAPVVGDAAGPHGRVGQPARQPLLLRAAAAL